MTYKKTHLSNGKVRVCKAKGTCPLVDSQGNPVPHFSTQDEENKFFENEHGMLSNQKTNDNFQQKYKKYKDTPHLNINGGNEVLLYNGSQMSTVFSERVIYTLKDIPLLNTEDCHIEEIGMVTSEDAKEEIFIKYEGHIRDSNGKFEEYEVTVVSDTDGNIKYFSDDKYKHLLSDEKINITNKTIDKLIGYGRRADTSGFNRLPDVDNRSSRNYLDSSVNGRVMIIGSPEGDRVINGLPYEFATRVTALDCGYSEKHSAFFVEYDVYNEDHTKGPERYKELSRMFGYYRNSPLINSYKVRVFYNEKENNVKHIDYAENLTIDATNETNTSFVNPISKEDMISNIKTHFNNALATKHITIKLPVEQRKRTLKQILLNKRDIF